ncbi:MAG: phosphonate C-P lyase system protein PhnG [Actinomycetota bacterium]
MAVAELTTDERTAIEHRAEMLAAATADDVRACADRCLAILGEPVVIEAPTTGIVMMQVREPVACERFHLGEVVVTRAEVELAGHRGWATRMGGDRVTALAAAICDAAAETPGPTAEMVADVVLDTERARERRERHLATTLQPTIVAFEELD